MEELFKDKADRDAAISHFTTLQQQPGWKILERIINANIEYLRDLLENGTGKKETKEEIDRIRDRIKVHKEIIGTPQNFIEKMKGAVTAKTTSDPYETVAELRKRRGLTDDTQTD